MLTSGACVRRQLDNQAGADDELRGGRIRERCCGDEVRTLTTAVPVGGGAQAHRRFRHDEPWTLVARCAGINPDDITRLVVDTYARQIFQHGFVHCDPHAGNVLVRRNPASGVPEIVLLDHGLYRELSDEFRYNYSHLWHAIIFHDTDKIRQGGAFRGVPHGPDHSANGTPRRHHHRHRV